ncbi:HD-GYP domain-containing protein [Amphibacillus sp. Q70]|uniref:HD-GYP domain-containing protein n=1 Tax=Amphibacillus sp. Q70 TaxID=3453416 RepID=UPI003F84BEBD
MYVHPNQLVEKCVIVKDVYSKSSHPIIAQDTVVTGTHIKVLKSFLVDQVEVASKLANGLDFKPSQVIPFKEDPTKQKTFQKEPSTFLEDYRAVVTNYARMFKQWQSGKTLDIHEVRQLIVPLIERADEHQGEIFLVNHYATKETYPYHHSVAISLLSTLLAKRLGFEQESIQIAMAALIADSGMAKVNHRILKHKGKLPKAEFEELKQHSTLSYRYVEKSPALTKAAKLAVLQHHERPDGRGYPLGITEDKIHSYTKIISIADAYHAMTSDRYHQQKQPFDRVIFQMQKEINRQFDSRYLKVFITCLEDALLEEKVCLSNGQTGTIVALSFTDYPEFIVQIHDTHEILSLSDQDELMIEYLIQR